MIELVAYDEGPSKYHGTLYSTGNKIIDGEIGRMWDNEIMLLHGPSKHGKTSYVLSVANMNGEAGVKTALFSLEMTRENLKMQQCLVRTGITRTIFEDKTYSERQWKKYQELYTGFDKNFTIFDEKSLPGEYEGYTLEVLIESIKMLHKEGYKLFIIDSLGLIGGGEKMSTNQRQTKIVMELRKLKNSIPIAIVLIHHNEKYGKTFTGSQNLENFVDWRVEVKKYLDPSADGISIFHQTKIRVFKERMGKELQFVFDYDKGNLVYNNHGYIELD